VSLVQDVKERCRNWSYFASDCNTTGGLVFKSGIDTALVWQNVTFIKWFTPA